MATQHRLAYLDALRGIAALWVVFFHATFIPRPALEMPSWLQWFVHSGDSGVQLFFVLSAFSLCYTMPRHLARTSPMASFYLSRFFRIAPLFYFMLAFLIFRQIVFYNYFAPRDMIIANFTFTFNLFPGWETGMVAASWTIGVEMIFYLIFPLIFFAVRNTWQAGLFVILSIALVFALDPFASRLGDNETHFRLFSITSNLQTFAWGILAYWVMPSLHASRWRVHFASALLVAAGVMFAIVASRTGPMTHASFLKGPMFAALMLGLSVLSHRFVVNRATTWAGKNSYSIYLLHPVVIDQLVPVYRWIYGFDVGQALQFLACVAITFAIVLPLSEVTNRLIEGPGERLGKRIISWICRPAPVDNRA